MMDPKARPEVGEYVYLPAWQTEGMVYSIRDAILGSVDGSYEVQIQEYPEQREDDIRRFRIEDDSQLVN